MGQKRVMHDHDFPLLVRSRAAVACALAFRYQLAPMLKLDRITKRYGTLTALG
jgi:hypothetical protein